jgi:hypothetical protein
VSQDKAEKNGVVAEITSDPEIALHFYSEFLLVMQRKGKALPYGIENTRALVSNLGPAGRLFMVCARHNQTVIATGLYPHDDRSMYYGDSAYEPAFLDLSPNELVHWTAMNAAIARGITVFNMGGAPQPRFTQKFGGSLLPYVTYEKACLPFSGTAIRMYRSVRDLARGISITAKAQSG